MSRVGLKPIELPGGVSVKTDGAMLRVSGPKGELETPVPPGISAVAEDGSVRFERADDNKQTRAYHQIDFDDDGQPSPAPPISFIQWISIIE